MIRTRNLLPLIALLSSTLLFAACAQPSVPPPPGPTAIPTAGVAPGPTTAPTPVSTPSDGPITLVWWSPEFLSTEAAQPVGPRIAELLASFEAEQGGRVRVETLPKARYGKGGILDLLRTAQPVAPDILPDLVVLDIGELPEASAAGLLQPLDELLGEERVAGLYPFARSAGTVNERLRAVQLLADVEHVAYHPAGTEEPILTWEALALSGTSYLFPVDGPKPLSATAPADGLQPVFISQYLSAGASFSLDQRLLDVKREPLVRLLTFYRDGLDGGVLPRSATGISDLADVWTALEGGDVQSGQVSARQFLRNGSALRGMAFGAMPGFSGPAQPVASGWAIAIVTGDPRRQRAAAEFIAWLLEPARAAGLARDAGWLPTTPAAFGLWKETPYLAFLNTQLTAAISPPAGIASQQAIARLQKALASVITGESTPAEAAEAATSSP